MKTNPPILSKEERSRLTVLVLDFLEDSTDAKIQKELNKFLSPELSFATLTGNECEQLRKKIDSNFAYRKDYIDNSPSRFFSSELHATEWMIIFRDLVNNECLVCKVDLIIVNNDLGFVEHHFKKTL